MPIQRQTQQRNYPAPEMITTTEALSSLCDRLQSEAFITIDTEFMREKTYWPDLCLVQLAGQSDLAIVDTCAADIDLAPLAALLDNPACTKVFHAARQDLEIFLHLFGRLPCAVYDTQVAAMVAGHGDQVGYDTLVQIVTGRGIDKSHRFSDWSLRPLSKAQLAYAAADVTHLREIYLALQNELASLGRQDWVAAEFAHLQNPATFQTEPDQMWMRLKPRTHNRRMLGVLRAIAAWREREAQRLNVPRQRVVRDESLLEIAATQPSDPNSLERIRGLSRNFVESHSGAGLLKAIAESLELPDDAMPRLPKKPDGAKPPAGVVALLRVLLIATCETHRIAPRLVASNDDIDQLALGGRDVEALIGWRREVFGEAALTLLSGQQALYIEGREIRFSPRPNLG